MGKNAPILSLDARVVRAFVALAQITELQTAIEKRRDDAGVPGYVRAHNALLERTKSLFQGGGGAGEGTTFLDSIGAIEPISLEVEDDSEAIHVIASDLALLRGAASAFLRVQLTASERADLGIA